MRYKMCFVVNPAGIGRIVVNYGVNKLVISN
jgi:hypothetical protein